MMNKSLILGVVALCALPAAGQAQTVTLLNENFNELTPQLAVTQAGAFHTIAGTNVDIFGAGVPMNGPNFKNNLCAFYSGSGFSPPNCLDLNGTAKSGPNGNPQATLVSNQTFTLEPGNTYHLDFIAGGTLRTATGMPILPEPLTGILPGGVGASLQWSLGTFTSQHHLLDLGTFGPNTTVRVDVPTASPITFRSLTPGDVGVLLDNIRLTCTGPTCARVGETVPEPATLGLLALGLLGAGFAGRKRRN